MRSFAGNMVAMLAARVVPALFSFVIHVTLARTAGVEVLGAFTSLLAMLTIFQAVTGAGMQLYLSREIAMDPARARVLVGHARAFGLVTGLLGGLLFAAYALAALPAHRFNSGVILGAALVPSAWITVQDSVFIGRRLHHHIAVIALIENGVKLGLALAALSLGSGLAGVCGAIVLARGLALTLGTWLLQRRGFAAPWTIDLGGIWRFAQTLAPFSLTVVLSMAYFRIDLPVVQLVLGEGPAGVYASAATLFTAVLLLPDSALAAAYPRLVAAHQWSPERFSHAAWRAARLVVLALVPLAVVLSAAAEWIVETVYGPAFAPAAPILRLLALTLPLHAVNGALGQALQGSGHQKSMVSAVVVALVVHAALTWFLAGRFGPAGAVVSMAITASWVGLRALHAVHTRLGAVRLDRRMGPSLLAVTAPLLLVGLAPAHLRVGAAFLALACYAGATVWSGALAELPSMRKATA